jgi:hypothetical protein
MAGCYVSETEGKDSSPFFVEFESRTSKEVEQALQAVYQPGML